MVFLGGGQLYDILCGLSFCGKMEISFVLEEVCRERRVNIQFFKSYFRCKWKIKV